MMKMVMKKKSGEWRGGHCARGRSKCGCCSVSGFSETPKETDVKVPPSHLPRGAWVSYNKTVRVIVGLLASGLDSGGWWKAEGGGRRMGETTGNGNGPQAILSLLGAAVSKPDQAYDQDN
jgi:hypothetical protein